MEKTMLVAFCTKSTMHGVIQHLSALDEWKDSIVIMERSFNAKRRGKYIPETRTIPETMPQITPHQRRKKRPQ
jgi:hypothetical protein